MKYKILKGTELYNKLTAIFKQGQDADNAIRSLGRELGAEKAAFAPGFMGGGVTGFYFESPPEGWKKAGTLQGLQMYLPRKNKANEAILQRIADLPQVPKSVVYEAIGFESPQFVDSLFIEGCGIRWNKAFILISMHPKAKYSPVVDMIEVTVSEYKALEQVAEK